MFASIFESFSDKRHHHHHPSSSSLLLSSSSSSSTTPPSSSPSHSPAWRICLLPVDFEAEEVGNTGKGTSLQDESGGFCSWLIGSSG
mmetsp:Transcript_2605/g.3544  ORF Transcript_2605/g.3544 Transcript_2605/m.3544 type:complete len:87 (-) Transcript_2605:397-657(-)